MCLPLPQLVLRLHPPEDLIFLLQLTDPGVEELDPSLELLHVLLLLASRLLRTYLILDLPSDLLEGALLALGEWKARRYGVPFRDQGSLLLLRQQDCYKGKNTN